MKYILFIAFSSEQRLRLGQVFWKGDYLERIVKYFDISKLKLGNISYGIAYFLTSEFEDSLCYEICIDDLRYSKKCLEIDFSIVKKLDLISSSVKSLIRKIIFPDPDFQDYTPYCFAIDEKEFVSYSEDELLLQQIKSLSRKNNWLEICKLFEPLESLSEKPVFWNNHNLLNALSFATAKLSEVYINLKREFKSDSDIKKYLKIKKRYRKITINIRKRCIELNPDNPGYYSNLAYSYYQFCLELATRGGRRDGSIREDAKKSLEFINKALELEPNRITDLYRKGVLLTNILPPVLLFGKNNYSDKNTIIEVKNLISDGIKAFQKVEEVYEIIPVIDEKRLIRYKKEYIKSLYNIAAAYYQLISHKWDYKQLIEQQIDRLNNDFEIENNIKFINSSIEYINKCCAKDLNNTFEINKNPAIYAGADYDGFVEGVFKLYSMGKYYLKKYLLNSKNLNSPSEIQDSIYYAEKCFKRALSYPFPFEKRKLSKAFIAEKLARIYIIKKNYNLAIQTLSNFCKHKTDYYVRYTLALAYFLNKDYTKAKEQVEQSISFPDTNKDILTAYYFLYHIESKLGNHSRSNEYLEKFRKITEEVA